MHAVTANRVMQAMMTVIKTGIACPEDANDRENTVER
jgi:hypothetical protein